MLNFGVIRFILKLYTDIGPNFLKSENTIKHNITLL